MRAARSRPVGDRTFIEHESKNERTAALTVAVSTKPAEYVPVTSPSHRVAATPTIPRSCAKVLPKHSRAAISSGSDRFRGRNVSGRSSHFPSSGQRAAIASYSWLALAPAPLRESFAGVLEHAEHHRALIDRFWRFPHRNRLHGRENTRAQKAWRRECGVRLGQ
jgi:hypothetical protein